MARLKKATSISFDVALLDQLQEQAKAANTSVSELVHQAAAALTAGHRPISKQARALVLLGRIQNHITAPMRGDFWFVAQSLLDDLSEALEAMADPAAATSDDSDEVDDLEDANVEGW